MSFKIPNPPTEGRLEFVQVGSTVTIKTASDFKGFITEDFGIFLVRGTPSASGETMSLHFFNNEFSGLRVVDQFMSGQLYKSDSVSLTGYRRN